MLIKTIPKAELNKLRFDPDSATSVAIYSIFQHKELDTENRTNDK